MKLSVKGDGELGHAQVERVVGKGVIGMWAMVERAGRKEKGEGMFVK